MSAGVATQTSSAVATSLFYRSSRHERIYDLVPELFPGRRGWRHRRSGRVPLYTVILPAHRDLYLIVFIAVTGAPAMRPLIPTAAGTATALAVLSLSYVGPAWRQHVHDTATVEVLTPDGEGGFIRETRLRKDVNRERAQRRTAKSLAVLEEFRASYDAAEAAEQAAFLYELQEPARRAERERLAREQAELDAAMEANQRALDEAQADLDALMSQ